MKTNLIRKIQKADNRYQWKPNEIEFVTCADLANDARRLVNFVPSDCQGIVAAPRSSLIPATIVATLTHLPMYSLQAGRLVALGSGGRGKFKAGKGRLFLVEDTSYGGGSISRCRSILGHSTIYSAVYARVQQHVDCYSRYLPAPHILEWNIFNNTIIAGNAADPRLRGFGFGCDFDGVLCEDAHFPHTSNNEAEVIEWIRNARPKYITRFAPIPLVVSMRLEKHREHIQWWLDKWGIRVNKLVLNQCSTFEERDKLFDYRYKGLEANKHRCTMFVESSEWQAQSIADLGGCPVIVPDVAKVVLPK